MTIRSDEAAAMLADVDSVVAKVKQSRIYRSAALIIILWGVVNVARDVLIALAPTWFGPRWFLIDAIGDRRHARPSSLRWSSPARASRSERWRRSASSTPSAGSGRTSSAGFGPREQMAFWPTLFLFGYALAGFGSGRRSPPSASASPRLILAGYLLVGRGVSAVASGRLRRRIHSVRPLDAAGLSDGRAGRRHPSAYSPARHGGADRLRSERRGP